jgi:CBS domain-containing protein
MIDLKKFGSRIFVDAARILALGAGIPETGTAPRLRRAAEEGVMTGADAEAWIHAFHAVQGIRLAVQVAAGERPGNLVDPLQLNDFDRRVLLEGLRQARAMQQLLKSRYHIET